MRSSLPARLARIAAIDAKRDATRSSDGCALVKDSSHRIAGFAHNVKGEPATFATAGRRNNATTFAGIMCDLNATNKPGKETRRAMVQTIRFFNNL